MTGATPTVTVLMSVYNGERYLKEAIQSVLDQDFDDFEFLIVDDASTDRSRPILDRFAKRDSRVAVTANPSNLGLARCLNQGIKVAEGNFVARLDADDLALPGRLTKQTEYLRSHPRCTVLGTAAKLIDASGQTHRVTETFSLGALKAQLLFFNPIIHSSVIYRRQVIADLGGYDEKFLRAQDYDLWLRCIAGGHDIHMLPDALASHRVHEGGVSYTQRDEMEHFRRLAVRRGWRNILGTELSDETVDIQRRLLKRLPISKPVKPMVVCRGSARQRQIFVGRFPGDLDAIERFDHIAKRLATATCALSGEKRELYEQLATGMNSAEFRIQRFLGLIRARISRARFHLGKWRRAILGR